MSKGCRFGCVLFSLAGARLNLIITDNVDTKRFGNKISQISRT